MKRILAYMLIAGILAGASVLSVRAAVPAAIPTGEPLSLADCQKIALANNTTLRLATADLAAAEARVGQATAPTHPQLALQSTWNRAQSPPGAPVTTQIGGSSVTFQSSPQVILTQKLSANLQQLIIDGGHTGALIKQAQAGRAASAYALTAQHNQILYQVSSAYFQALAGIQLVEVADATLRQAREHLKLAEAGYKAGAVAKADVVFAKVPVAQATLALTRVRHARDLSFAALLRVIGLDVNTAITLTDPLAFQDESVDPDQSRQDALANRPEVAAAAAQLEAATHGASAARTGNAVNLWAGASYNWTGYDAQAFPIFPGWNYGLTLNVPVLNGALTHYQFAEAQANLDKARINADATRQDVLLQVKQAYLNVTAARDAVATTKVQVEMAVENRKMAEGQYKAGVSPILNVIDAQTLETQALNDQTAALAAYNIALAQLHQATGK